MKRAAKGAWLREPLDGVVEIIRLGYANAPDHYFGGNLERTSWTAFFRSLDAASVLM